MRQPTRQFKKITTRLTEALDSGMTEDDLRQELVNLKRELSERLSQLESDPDNPRLIDKIGYIGSHAASYVSQCEDADMWELMQEFENLQREVDSIVTLRSP